MKRPLILIASLALVLPVAAETVEINGKKVELPDSVVGQVLHNRDAGERAAALAAKLYPGTTASMDARRVAAKLRAEGPTDANVSALEALEKRLEAEAVKAPAPEQPKPDPRRAAFDAAVANGFDTGLGFRLGLRDADRNAFTQMLVLVNTAKEKGIITDATPQTIADIDGKAHVIKTGQFTSLMLAYGARYKALWDKLKEGN